MMMMVAVCLGACGSSSDAKETLYVYNWSEYIPEEVYELFEEETGIHVVESTFSSNEEMLAKMVAGGASQYDVIIASNYVLEAMKAQGFIQQIDTSHIENFSNLYDEYVGMSYDPDNSYSVPYMATVTVIAANREMCEELGVEITCFEDLLNPALENNIVAVDDCREIVGIALKAAGIDPDTTDQAEIESVLPWLEELSTNIKLYDSDTPYTALLTNEVAVGIVYNMDAALAIAENDAISVITTTEPDEMSVDNFTISSECENVEAAEAFINFILRPDIYKMCLDAYPCINLNAAAEELLDAAYLENEGSNLDRTEVARAHIIGDVGDAAEYYDAVFSEMKN